MAKLELQSLNKTYNPKTIPVKDISLTVEDGEFLTLLGPSGCGKSTTLRLIAGLEPPTHGTIRIGDRDVSAMKPGDRNIAMVFQSYALYPHMNVFDNMASALELKQIGSDEIRRRVLEASTFLDLSTDLLDRKPGQLSGGQRQRVALGRALVRDPDVFLLDEPLSNLDALLRESVRAQLKRTFERQNAPVVYVTHDQVEAMTLSTKVAVLDRGVVQQLDAPDRLYRKPANQFVAGFVGSPQMNLIGLRCDKREAILSDTRIPLPSGIDVPAIVLGIRPESLSLCDTAAPDRCAQFSGAVTRIENLGMYSAIAIEIAPEQAGGQPRELRATLETDIPAVGDRVSLAADLNSLHWFDADSGQRLND